MQIVIDVPYGIYDFLMEHTDRQSPYATEWVRQGTPLPKGHGRLIDADALFEKFEETGWFNNADRDEVAERILLNAPTIIKADKEVSDGR